MNNNLRMSGAMFLMLKKSSDRRQREALEAAFKVIFISGQYTSFFGANCKSFQKGPGFSVDSSFGVCLHDESLRQSIAEKS